MPGERVDVIKTFEAQLEETAKIDLYPELPPLDTTTKLQTYDIPVKDLLVEYPAAFQPLTFEALVIKHAQPLGSRADRDHYLSQ